ncbi:MAG: glycosyltransferase family 2 protein [Myxococcota bacterium]
MAEFDTALPAPSDREAVRQGASLRYSVVLPVFNEGANIRAFCESARAHFPPGYELLVCYDRDEDDTLPALAAIPAELLPEPVRLIKNDIGPGVRYAIEAGMQAARAPVVVVTMADLCDDPRGVERLVKLVEAGADVACASRYARGGAQLGGPWLKKQLSRAAGLTLHYLAGLPTRDPTNSFKAYRKAFLDRTRIESTAGFSLGIELTVKAHLSGGVVAEVPSTWRARVAGQSRFRLAKWLPQYLRWYALAFRGRMRSRSSSGARSD